MRRLGYKLAHALLRAYWFIARPQGTGVKCVLLAGDRVLLVRHTYGPRRWELPGGTLKSGEPAVEGAKREMHEELGIETEQWRDLGAVRTRVHHKHDTLRCFQARIDGARLVIDRGEIAAVEWFSPDDLPPDAPPYVHAVLARLPR